MQTTHAGALEESRARYQRFSEDIPMTDLFSLPHSAVAGQLQSGAPVFLAVNPVEYHGPHLALNNDTLITRGLIRDLHARLLEDHPEWPLLFGGDLRVGVEPTAGVGSQFTPYKVVSALTVEACRSLADLGAQRVVLMTFHGDPMHSKALHEGVKLLQDRGVQVLAPMNLILRAMLDLEPQEFAVAFEQIEDPVERQTTMEGLPYDFHAGYFETSLSLHYAPESVSPDYTALAPCPEVVPFRSLSVASRLAAAAGFASLSRELRYAAMGRGWQALRPFPGYTSRPHLANAEAGRLFAGFIVDRFVTCAEQVFAGKAQSPEPIMPWLASVSLGGRVGDFELTPGKLFQNL